MNRFCLLSTVNDMEVKLGAPQQCPACGHSNPSGRELPRDCMWCGPTGEQDRIKKMFEKAKVEPMQIQLLGDNEDEEIKDPGSFWNMLKTTIYWIVRIPVMLLDPHRKD